MAEFFHPDLPGVVRETLPHQVRTAREGGWRQWDELTGEQQQAHEDATAAAAEEAALVEPVQPDQTEESPEPPAAGDTTTKE